MAGFSGCCCPSPRLLQRRLRLFTTCHAPPAAGSKTVFLAMDSTASALRQAEQLVTQVYKACCSRLRRPVLNLAVLSSP